MITTFMMGFIASLIGAGFGILGYTNSRTKGKIFFGVMIILNLLMLVIWLKELL